MGRVSGRGFGWLFKHFQLLSSCRASCACEWCRRWCRWCRCRHHFSTPIFEGWCPLLFVNDTTTSASLLGIVGVVSCGVVWCPQPCDTAVQWCGVEVRSEEHTSELQSRFDLVCRLLLEKRQLRVRC